MALPVVAEIKGAARPDADRAAVDTVVACKTQHCRDDVVDGDDCYASGFEGGCDGGGEEGGSDVAFWALLSAGNGEF